MFIRGSSENHKSSFSLEVREKYAHFIHDDEKMGHIVESLGVANPNLTAVLVGLFPFAELSDSRRAPELIAFDEERLKRSEFYLEGIISIKHGKPCQLWPSTSQLVQRHSNSRFNAKSSNAMAVSLSYLKGLGCMPGAGFKSMFIAQMEGGWTIL